MESTRMALLQARYMHQDAGEVEESQVWERVARTWARHSDEVDQFYEMMAEGWALPNTPAIANAGRKRQQGSACFVLPIDDSLNVGEHAIMKTLDAATRVHATGGGTGFSFSRLRGRGSKISTTNRPSPGAVEILKMYSDVMARISQSGVRWGANMGVLSIDHPDFYEFISCKAQEFEESGAEDGFRTAVAEVLASLNGHAQFVMDGVMSAFDVYLSQRNQGTIHNFNISVGIDDDFMERMAAGTLTEDEQDKWNKIVYGAWHNGEPGILWLERINKLAPHPEMIEATNPCGEVPLLPGEACVLGSANIAAHMALPRDGGAGAVNWSKLEHTVRTLTRMLDNIVEIQDYPLPFIEQVHRRYRKIGAGMMGLADAMILHHARYGDARSVSFAAEVSRFIQAVNYEESIRLAEQYGPYPGWQEGMPYRRNLCGQVIAPTGSISRLIPPRPTSFGIECNYAATQESWILGATEPFIDIHPLAHHSHFVTNAQITLKEHIDVLCAVQKYTDQAVSKTCNVPESASVEDIDQALQYAYAQGAKGITVLREGSRAKVVLKDHSGKHTADEKLSEGAMVGAKVIEKHQTDCVGGACEL